MDRKKSLAQNMLDAATFLEHPAHLLMGNEQQTLATAQNVLQQLLCNNNGCAACVTCQLIVQRQHHAISWIVPEKQYTLEMIEPILHSMSFALDPDQFHFFVLQKSDTLSTACANRLLKSLEEPGRGYHFILLAQRLSAVLPTIRSRCLVHMSAKFSAQSTDNPLRPFFLQPAPEKLNLFLSTLQTSAITEQESIELVDELLRDWIALHKQEITEQNEKEKTVRMIKFLKSSLLTPPMPGSAKIFWKNLYITAISTA